ncbi:MAG: hypothetical protein K2N48_04635 [Muribaculaceae bacterium]|nr:hypothetical protein [Muribaculaceae bacterium]
MKIQKIFSNIENPQEVLFHVQLSESEMKIFTQWDETDRLKQMKDSDILAEKKKKNPSRFGGMLKGTGIGGAIGATGGALLGMRKGWKGAAIGAAVGGSIGSTVGGGAGMMSGSKQRKENEFYNDRLRYAQRQAQRRERKDWKQNMTQREGYTY